jgi:glutamate-1-semialdehyde 2,1-aminomutase
VIGGGLPVGAFGGREDVLAVLAPLGPVYQAGTLSGNPLATAAGRTVLDTLTPEAYRDLSASVDTFGGSLQGILAAALAKAGATDAAGRPLTARVPVAGPLLGMFFVPEGGPDVSDFDGAAASADTGLYAKFFRAMLDRGVALAPGPYEVAFPSLAHGVAEYDRALECADEAITEALAG